MNDLQGHCVSRAMKNHIFLSESVAAFFIRLYNNNFFEFSKAIEEIIHDSVHIGLGGTMNDLEQSPSDPVFWFHHSYIDYVWTKWQAFPNNYFRYIVHESDPEFNSKRILGYSIPQLMDYKTTFCTAYQDPSSNVPPALPLKNAEKYVPLLTQVLFTSPEFERKFSKEKDLNWIVSKIQILENYLIHILKLGEGWPTLERPTEHEMKELNKIVEIEKNSQTQRYALSLVSFILLSFFWGTVVEIFSN
ncbi:hypothetical protein HMI54_003487 [Coelomomyces lativittatus]|nr:hypothetical protein HMI54_003487 [Coelomomyces lativittatus]